jgi:dephospho-CoA kinase
MKKIASVHLQKYYPTTQKALFQKQSVNQIKQFLSNVVKSPSDKLYVYGNMGCGKTSVLKILLKQYNVIELIADDIRSSDKHQDLLQHILNFHDQNFNLLTTNFKKENSQKNIVLIDNIELCDQNLKQFIELIENKYTVPIVLIANSKKYLERLKKNDKLSEFNIVCVQVTNPTNDQLKTFIEDINTKLKLNLTYENISDILNYSNQDLRQIYFVLDQWIFQRKTNLTNFDAFLSGFQQKIFDIDFIDSIKYILDAKSKLDISDALIKLSSEPLVFATGVFQNYIETLSNDTNLDDLSKIAEQISYGNMYSQLTFKMQEEELFDYQSVPLIYTSYLIKNSKNHVTLNSPSRFRDISYNYINSLNDVKSRTILNISELAKDMSIGNITQLLFTELKLLNDQIPKTRKLKQRIENYNGLTDILERLQRITNFILEYKMYNFEEGTNSILPSDFEIYYKTNINKIDIRLLKKFINVYCFDSSQSIIKNSELLILESILKQIYQSQINKKSSMKQCIDKFTELNLTDIWNLN